MEQRLEKLKSIKKVEAPPYLFTRIDQRIYSLSEDVLSSRIKWSFSIGAVFVIALNISAIIQSGFHSRTDGIVEVVNMMNMDQANSLYDE